MTTPEPPEPQGGRTSTNAKAGIIVGWLFIAVLVYNVATSCNDDDPYEPAMSNTEPITPLASAGTVSSPDDLIASAGVTLPCTYSRVISAPVDARAQSNCDDDRIIIRVYDSTDLDGMMRSLALLGLNKATFLAGENWTISAENPVILPGVQSLVGGKIINLSAP